jgi:putative transposase
MARPLRISYPHAYYHVTCRGNDRRAIFRDDRDRTLFLEKLRVSIEIYGVKLHAYVLMGNHFHFIAETPKANLSEFMRHFNIGYTGGYNRRHRRVGHLYQGRYKAVLVEKDSYLLELSRYVHLNPVRIMPWKRRSGREQLRFLERYRWSSLGGYWGTGRKESWVSYHEVLGQVGGSRSRYRQFIEEGLEKGYDTPWEKVKGQAVLGEDEFVEKLRDKIVQGGPMREQPALRHLGSMEAADVLQRVSRYFGIKLEELAKKRTPHRDSRAVVMEMMYRYGKISQEEIGKRLGGLDYSAVSRERTRLRERLDGDRKLQRTMKEIDNIIKSKVKI